MYRYETVKLQKVRVNLLQKSFIELSPGTLFTTPHFLHNLIKGPIGYITQGRKGLPETYTINLLRPLEY
jgi:hypothetical protein